MKRTVTEALAAWKLNLPTQLSPDQGLINQTWIVGSSSADDSNDTPFGILQWVNPIFDPMIHTDLRAVLSHLKSLNALTPELVALPDGSNMLLDTEGCWRLWSFIPGRTIHTITSPEQAYGAGKILGTFHAQLSTLHHHFVAPRRDIHNTPQRMMDLENALAKAESHPLYLEAKKVGSQILANWGNWNAALNTPKRVCHGDPKISNIRFAPSTFDQGCMIDLDTIGPSSLAVEMGDAWRSWCNPAGEDEPQNVCFDLDAFASSAEGWLDGWSSAGAKIDPAELHSLVPGIERICLELAARFCADSVNNSYFKEDLTRFPQPGQHNLIRALSQLTLAIEARQQAEKCHQILGS